MDKKEDIQKKIVQFQVLEANLKALQEREEIINERILEIENTKAAIEELKKSKPNKAFIPLGSGNFIAGNIENIEEIIVGIGSGVAIKKSREDAIEILDSNFKELEKNLSELRNQGASIALQLAKIQDEVEKLQE